MPPHVYGIAEQAYQSILGDGSNQSILVSGESGAGKTESVKIMRASPSSQERRRPEQGGRAGPRVQSAARGVRQRADDAEQQLSRFGKFIEIQFDRHYKMAGARIHIYLLEKSRVVQQSSGERSYHVFYQLLQGFAGEGGARTSTPIESLALLNQSGCVVIDGVDDAEEMRRTRSAMGDIGLGEGEVGGAVGLVASVLLLAQLAFGRTARSTR